MGCGTFSFIVRGGMEQWYFFAVRKHHFCHQITMTDPQVFEMMKTYHSWKIVFFQVCGPEWNLFLNERNAALNIIGTFALSRIVPQIFYHINAMHSQALFRSQQSYGHSVKWLLPTKPSQRWASFHLLPCQVIVAVTPTQYMTPQIS